MNELMYLLKVFVTPMCWIRTSGTNRIWDRAIRHELKNPKFTNYDRYTVELNGKQIWVANYPYASFTDYATSSKGMPSRRTVFMFNDALTKASIDGNLV